MFSLVFYSIELIRPSVWAKTKHQGRSSLCFLLSGLEEVEVSKLSELTAYRFPLGQFGFNIHLDGIYTWHLFISMRKMCKLNNNVLKVTEIERASESTSGFFPRWKVM